VNLQERNLTAGLTGTDVAELHTELSALGYSIPEDETKASSFGPGTLAAVQQFQVAHKLDGNGAVDAATAAALTGVIAGITYKVSGTISSAAHASVGTLLVELIDKNIGGDQILARTETTANGAYAFSTIITPAELKLHNKTQPDLQVSVLAGSTVLATSEVTYNSPTTLVVDLSLPADASGLPSEFDSLSATVARLYPGKLSELQENAKQTDITFLANKSEWDPRLIAMAALADQLAQTTAPANAAPAAATNAAASAVSLQPAFYYALLRAGVPSDPDELFLLTPAAATAIWTQAASQGVIPASLQADIAAATQSFQTLAANHVLQMKPAIGVSTLTAQVSPVLTNLVQQGTFATLLTQHAGDWTEFWKAAGAAFGDQSAAQLQTLGKLHYLTLNNAPLVAALAKAVPSAATSLQSLASNGLYDPGKWTPLIADSLPPGLPGATPAEQASNYADFLAAQVKLAFPTGVLADQVSRGIVPVAGAADVITDVSGFLSIHQDSFAIGAEPVDAFIDRTQVAAPSDAALEQIRRLQRVYQLTTSDNAMTALLEHELDSAFAITRYDKAGFVRAMGARLGGADAAAAVHTRARQVFNAVLNIVARYAVGRRGPAIGDNLKLIDNPGMMQHAPTRPAATLQQLFGSLDYCSCSDCNSILSPAAYFVDLLHYLDQPAPSQGLHNPQSELFSRRPDLQYLALSCENTNTALPYIDIVNETLEAFVMGDLSLDGYEGFNTPATITSAELIAAPQNIDDAAYAVLQNSFFPAPLPFNRPLELLRRHVQALNVTLPNAMIALRADDALTNAATPTSYGWRDILIEQLSLSRDEYRLFTDATLAVSDLYGMPLAAIQNLTLQQFSSRTGVTYVDLVAILRTRFVNPGSALIERVEDLGVGFAAIQVLHGNPVANAPAFIAGLPADLDYTQYSGSDGQAVVDWLTHDNYASIMGLITIGTVEPAAQDSAQDCSGSALRLAYADPSANPNVLTATDLLKLIRFIRLWRKLQTLLQISDDSAAIHLTDALLSSLYPPASLPSGSNDAANDAVNRTRLDAGFGIALQRAGFAIQLLDRLTLDWTSLTRLLACWADIDTAGAQSLYAGMFLTPTLLQQDPGAQAASISGIVYTGDKLITTIDSLQLPAYVVVAGDTAQTVATKIAAAINATNTVDPVSGSPLNQRFRAQAMGSSIVITAGFAIRWQTVGTGGGTLTPNALTDPTSQSAAVGGTPAAGQSFSVTIDTVPVAYAAQAGDDPNEVAAGLSAAINQSTALHPYSGLPLNSLLSASSGNATVTVRTADAGPPFALACAFAPGNNDTYSVGASKPAYVEITLSGAVTTGDVVTLVLNTMHTAYTVAATDTSLTILATSLANVANHATAQDPATKLPLSQVLHATSSGAKLSISPVEPSSAFTVTVSSSGTEQFTLTGSAPASQPAIVKGDFAPGAVLTTIINGVNIYYSVVAGDTADTIALKIATLIASTSATDPDSGKPLNSLVSTTTSGSTITVTASQPTTTFTLSASGSRGAYTAGHLTPPFADNGYGVFLPGGPQTLFAHQPLICAACNLTGVEFALITTALGFDASTPLTLPNVSAVFRQGWLAHALGLSVLEFLTLRRLSGLDPFAPLDASATAPAEPAAIRFVRLVQAMQSVGLAPVQALYLLWNQNVSGTLAPDFATIAGLAQTLRSAFAVIGAQFGLQDDPDGSIAKQLMAQVYGTADTDFFFGLLNQTFTVSVPCDYGSAVLPQPVLDATGGRVAYDGATHTLSTTQILANSDAASIAAAARVNTTDKSDNVAAGQVTLTPLTMSNIAPGAALVIDSAAAQETVVVSAQTATSFSVNTALPHNGTATPFAIVNDPSLPVALAALATASQQAVQPFFGTYPELRPLYDAYAASNAPVQKKRQTLLANFLPTLIRLRKTEQALATITAQVGCDASFAAALLRDATVLHADADATQPAITDLTGIEAGGLGASFYAGNDLTKPPFQSTDAVGPIAYAQTANLGGTPVAGAVLTTTINGQAIAYTATPADTTLAVLALQMAAAVNACNTADPISKRPINSLVTASATDAAVVLRPTQPLAAASVFALTCASSNAALTYTPDSQLPANGGGPVTGVWSGYLTAPQSGDYDFCVIGDPGATVTLTIGQQAVPLSLVNGVLSNSTPVPLVSGQLTPIRLSAATLKTTLALGWRSPPGLGWTPVPAAALFPALAMTSLNATYVRFLKAVSLASALSLSADEIAWLGTDTARAVKTTCSSITLAGTAIFTPASMSNIAVGVNLTIDTGALQEIVTVISVDVNTGRFTAAANNAHDGSTSPFQIVSTATAVLNRGWLNSLPGTPDADPAHHPLPDAASATQLSAVFAAVLDVARVKQSLSPDDERLLSVLRAPQSVLPNGQSALLSLTGWAEVSVRGLNARFFGDGSLAPLADARNFARVFDAMTLVQGCGVTAPTLLAALTDAPTPASVSALQSALRARYTASDWLTIATPINNAMRQAQRDALLAFILEGLSGAQGNAVVTVSDLYSSLLIDPLTEPPVQTSRIRLALSAVQLFIEQIVRGLEKNVAPGDVDLQQWSWMKRYRVWQANREVFLWPENWLFPDLRDDQSPIFQKVMSKLLQSDITDDAATAAYLDYLAGLADVAKLEPCGMYYVPSSADTDEIVYVVSRSFGAHRKYYFRQLSGAAWTPWSEVPIECEDMPLAPIVWNGRLFLFWLKIQKPSPVSPQSVQPDQSVTAAAGTLSVSALLDAGPQTLVSEVDVQATLWWTEYYNGQWQSPKSSDPNRPTTIGSFDPTGAQTFDVFRNQVRIVPATCKDIEKSITSALASTLGNALILAISSPRREFPRLLTTTHYARGDIGPGCGFLLHNTHSTPIPLEDVRIGLVGNLGNHLDTPIPYRAILAPDDPLRATVAPYSAGPQDAALELHYFNGSAQDVQLNKPDASVVPLQFHWLPRIVDAQPGLTAMGNAPFLYEDRRNLFYVTTQTSQSSFRLWSGFGIGWGGSSSSQSTVHIPPLNVITKPVGNGVTVALEDTSTIAYQGSQIARLSAAISATAEARRA
jgi:hypothetical protein